MTEMFIYLAVYLLPSFLLGFLALDVFQRNPNKVEHRLLSLFVFGYSMLFLASRVGGDEFYIYLVDLTESEVRGFIHKLQMTLNQNPYQTSDVSIPIRASIGVSHAPDQGTNLDTLIHKADQAMYQIKQDGKNDYAIYDEALHGPK